MKKMIEGFVPMGGKHCITNALKQVFCFYGHPITEEMLFGVASGLSFASINLASGPMISGRTKIFAFENKVAGRLNIQIRCRQPKNSKTAFLKAKAMIDRNEPVLIYVDMLYLNYLHLEESGHFGGHAVVLLGCNDEERIFYVSDRDNGDHAIRTPAGNIAADCHAVSFEELERARGSSARPFPANNKYLQFDFENFLPVTAEVIACAIGDTCDTMLDPPAALLGLRGIAKFAREIKKWEKFDRQKLQRAGKTNYFQISADGGTGGGIFRKMYGAFLMQAEAILPGKGLAGVGEGYIALADRWDALAVSMWELGETGDAGMLAGMSGQAFELCQEEQELLVRLKRAVS